MCDVNVKDWNLMDDSNLIDNFANEIVKSYIECIKDDPVGLYAHIDDDLNIYSSLLVGCPDERLVVKEPLSRILRDFVSESVEYDSGAVADDRLLAITNLKQILIETINSIDKALNNPTK